MNILLVNDDGYQAEGILALVKALSSIGDVFICAPHVQRSGASQSITIHDELFVERITIPGAKKAITTTGTPADCTKVGIQFFEQEGVRMDLVVSGINLGTNMGVDTLYSGTIGAAMEASLEGIHAIAVSIDSFVPTDFSLACEVVLDLIPFAMEKTSVETILNINIPNLPRKQVKGVRYARLGRRYYRDVFVRQESGSYKMDGSPISQELQPRDVDISAHYDGYVTITPLQVDYTDFTVLKELQKLNLSLH